MDSFSVAVSCNTINNYCVSLVILLPRLIVNWMNVIIDGVRRWRCGSVAVKVELNVAVENPVRNRAPFFSVQEMRRALKAGPLQFNIVTSTQPISLNMVSWFQQVAIARDSMQGCENYIKWNR